jgi:hypothetical protein
MHFHFVGVTTWIRFYLTKQPTLRDGALKTIRPPKTPGLNV